MGYQQQQLLPGGLSPDSYVDRGLRPSDADHYSAAGIVPYRRSEEGIQVLLVKERPWNSFTSEYDPLGWNVLSGKRVPRQERAAEVTALRSFQDALGDVVSEVPCDDLRAKLSGAELGNFVSWYPKGRFALLFVEVGSLLDDLPGVYNAQGPPKEQQKEGRWVKQIEAFEWVAGSDLQPEPKGEVCDLFQNILQVTELQEFLKGNLDPTTVWPPGAPRPEVKGGFSDGKGKGKGKWGGGGGKGKGFGGKGWKGNGGGKGMGYGAPPVMQAASVMPVYYQQGMMQYDQSGFAPQQFQQAAMMPVAEGGDSELQRQAYGEQLFIMVQPLTPTTYIAQKITGMLLELPSSELVLNLTNQDELVRRVNEAMEVLREDGVVA